MFELEITNLDYNKNCKGVIFKRIAMAFQCLFCKRVAIITKKEKENSINCTYINFSQSQIGGVMRSMGKDLYDSANAVNWVNDILQ